jgi:hypothetical protein
MKRLTLIISLAICSISLFAQNPPVEIDSVSKILTGAWELEKVIDENDNEVKFIKKEMMGSPIGDAIQVKATGPKITLFENGNFELEFTPENTDKGNWFMESSNILILELVTKKGSDSYNMLKAAADMFAKKLKYDKEGNIVEYNAREIVKLNATQMQIRYETNYYQVYKKIN